MLKMNAGKRESKEDKVAKEMVDIISLIDYWRPSNLRLYPGRGIPLFDFKIMRHARLASGLGKDLKEIESFVESYRKKSIEEVFSVRYFVYFVALLLVYLSLKYLLDKFYRDVILENPEIFPNPVLIVSLLFILIVALVVAIVFLMVTREKNRRGKKYEDELVLYANKLIRIAKYYFMENNIDPKSFPIKLAHTDYTGLTYKKKGRIYHGFIKLEGGG